MKKNILLSIALVLNVLSAGAGVTVPSPDPSLRDLKTDPCDNFYQYACGSWIENAKIPADKPLWDRSFAAISERNKEILKTVLEKYSKGRFEPANSYAQKLGDFYASCMDESKLEKGSMATFKKEFKRLDSLSKENLAETVGWMHLRGMRPFFSFGYTQDFKNPQEVIAELAQGGLGLPTKDYYLDSSEKMKSIREKYVKHIEKMLVLAGEKSKAAHASAEKILAFETKLAQASLAPVELRDPTKLYHRIDKAALMQAAPNWNWEQYLNAIQLPNPGAINNAIPQFVTALNELLPKTELSDLKAYLKLKFVEGSARALPDRFYEESFSFYGKSLTGIKEMPVRWKRCVDATNEAMGFALGRSFVELTFAGPSKEIAQNMIQRIEKQQGQMIDQASWMDSKTRQAAHEKLNTLINQIGYPDVWRKYDTLKVARGSYLENRYNSTEFNHLYHLGKIGKPLDRTDWDMNPPEVNAYYDAQMTKMVFPAGILQPPFFDADYTSPANYGGIGMVMAHEITHGFDDQGRKFDAKGAMVDWWTPKVGEEFEKRASCLAKQYDSYPAVGGGHVNGQLTLGENIADQGGVKVSFMAWKEQLPKGILQDENKLREEEKNFFLSFAQSWCGKTTDAFEQILVNTNPHSPNRYRVNGSLSNFSEFAKAYQCKSGAKMVPANQCVVW